MIIDGKALSEQRLAELKLIRASFGPLSLGHVVATDDVVINSYVKIKRRVAGELDIEVREYRLPESATTAEVVDAVQRASKEDGVILQLPLPPAVDAIAARNALPLSVDVDALSDEAFKLFSENNYPATPPVAAAIRYIIQQHPIEVVGKKVVVVGRGRLVGEPAAALMRNLGGDVTVVDSRDDLAAAVAGADIIVLGAGVPFILKPEMIREGVAIFDAGASESSGKVVGDADPACAAKAALFTPVPRGIGPLTIVEIFANLFELKRRTVA
ncbi:MAG: tetrahydrofolate dehydrogenase/cyclohydrolase catalytic domain-containing protein [Patescibacteria group bacterium]